MEINSTKPIVVAGATASGKTKLALNLAQKHNGELINADSRQVYRYLDISTNKELKTGEQMLNGIKIHLLSYLEPDAELTVADWVQQAEQAIEELLQNGKLPIIVGGTGHYIDALINGLDLGELSVERRAELRSWSLQQLQTYAKTNYPDAFEQLNESDRANPRRLITLIARGEAVETQKFGGKFDYQIIYLRKTIEQLEPQLKERVEQMWQNGIVEEVKSVIEHSNPEIVAGHIAGGAAVLSYLAQKITATECKQRIYLAHRQYAKRQITWFEKHIENYKNFLVS